MYAVSYEADYAAEPRKRWRTGFRFILVIPWLLLGSAFVTGAFIISVIAWFAIAFTGRFPADLYKFNAGALRFITRANGFLYLQTDEWPPFGWEEAPEYPIRALVDPPLERYSRPKAIFRLILGFPVLFMLYLIGSLYPIAGMIAWFHIVFTGRSSAGTHNVLSYGLAYQLRATAYFLLMTETLPPISEQEPLTGA